MFIIELIEDTDQNWRWAHNPNGCTRPTAPATRGAGSAQCRFGDLSTKRRRHLVPCQFQPAKELIISLDQ